MLPALYCIALSLFHLLAQQYDTYLYNFKNNMAKVYRINANPNISFWCVCIASPLMRLKIPEPQLEV